MGIEISEFKGRDTDKNGPVDILRRPPLNVQPGVVISNDGARSATFNVQTGLLRIIASADCRILVYSVPEGVDATLPDASGADGKSEFFPAGEHVISIKAGAGNRLAVIAAASA